MNILHRRHPARIISVICGLFWLSTCGCASLRNSDVVSVEVKQDTDKARKLNEQGIQTLHAGETELARQMFRKSIHADPAFGPAWNNLGRMCFDAGNLYAAATNFQKASEFMPEHPDPLNNLGLTMEEAGRLEDAIAYYETAMSMNPNHPAYVGNLIRARLQRGDPQELLRAEIQQLRFVEKRPQWREWVNDHTNLFDNPMLEKPAEINDLSALLNELNSSDPQATDDTPRVILDSSKLEDTPDGASSPLPDSDSSDGPEMAPPPKADGDFGAEFVPVDTNDSGILQPALPMDSSAKPASSGWKKASGPTVPGQ